MTMTSDKIKATVPLERKLSREQIEKMYAHIAWIYDRWAKLTESRAVSRALELANIRDGERVLEVAVGTGVVFKEIVERNMHGENEGLDISPVMLSAAVERMKGCDPNFFHLQIGSCYSLPFDDGRFDLVISNYMFDLLPLDDFVTILRGFHRVLRPHGRLVMVTMTWGEKWYNQIWPWIARNVPSLLAGCRPVFLETYVARAGFRNIKTELLSQNTVASQIVVANTE